MPAVNVPNSIVAGEPITASPVNGNFQYLETWLNANVIQKDGSKAFDVLPTAPADVLPTVGSQLITKKALDDRTGLAFFTEHTTSRTGIANDASFKALDVVSVEFTMPIIQPGRVFTVEVIVPIIQLASSGGWPAHGQALDIALFMGPTFGSMSRVQVSRFNAPAGASLFPDASPSVTVKRTFRDNTQFAALSTQKVELRGRVPAGNGQFTVTGNAEYPIQMLGKMS